jgi:hypothetical protein
VLVCVCVCVCVCVRACVCVCVCNMLPYADVCTQLAQTEATEEVEAPESENHFPRTHADQSEADSSEVCVCVCVSAH